MNKLTAYWNLYQDLNEQSLLNVSVSIVDFFLNDENEYLIVGQTASHSFLKIACKILLLNENWIETLNLKQIIILSEMILITAKNEKSLILEEF